MRTNPTSIVVKKPSLMLKLYLLPPFLKMLLAAVVFFIICFVGFSYLQKKSADEAAMLRAKKSVLESEVYQGARARGEIKYLAANEGTLKQSYQALLKAFPPESKISDLLAHITKIGTDEGLKFISFTPQTAINQGYYAEAPVAISVVGTFHQIGRFLSSIANLPESAVAVNQFSITRVSGPDVTGDLLSLQFTATIYYILPNAAEITV